MFLLDPVIFPWDLAILVMMAAGVGVAFAARTWIRRHRSSRWWKKTFIGAFGVLGLFGALVIVYGSFIEPRMITVTRLPAELRVSQPLKIAVLSDFHVGPYKGESYLRRVVQKTNALLPDIVLIAGDYTYDDRADITMLEPLRDLRASLGVYAVMGNHDAGHYVSLLREPYELRDLSVQIALLLEGMGIDVLQNEHVLKYVGNDDIAIAGIDDVWMDTSSVSAALEGIPEGTPTILLSHSPDVLLDPESTRAHLITVGHTHGGQVRLPWWGAVPVLPTRVGKIFDQGLFTIDGDTTLAVTRGLGETLARARLLAWPEILLLEVSPST